ncbi:MAG: glycosyltransferase family 2 protein [bacterium]|nr:glycosyltransferase family 2 protein [bacterium]
MQPFLSVIIPSYNEQKNFASGVLDTVLTYLQAQDYTWEVILSDDGSSDGTVELLHAFASKNQGVRVLENKHAGKAATVSSGMLAATGSWRLFTDFDQSTPLSEVEKLLAIARDQYDVVIGSREIAGAQRDDEPFYRHLMGRVFNLVVQILAVPGIYDTQCGFKLFSDRATNDLFSRLSVYGNLAERRDAYTGAFDVELLYIARKMKYKIAEVPIHWEHRETNRVSPVKDSLRMFFDIVRIRFAALRGRYE